LRDAYHKFQRAGIEIYAISYDDQAVLREFSEKQKIPYRLLSDVDSTVIERFGILNDQVGRGDAFLTGIPYPGVYITDEDGTVIAKSFHHSYKKRDSPEMLIDAALGTIQLDDDGESASDTTEALRVTAKVHGGKGTIRQGVRRQLVVRCELANGMHLYGEPVPDGMVPTTISLSGPPGLVIEETCAPATTPLHLESMGMTLPIWHGIVDFVIPFYATGELASETRPLDVPAVDLELTVRYQACNDEICLAPQTLALPLRVSLEVVDVPALGMHTGHGQKEGNFSGAPHMARLILRKFRQNPLGLPRLIWKTVGLEWAARRRRAERK
jgi:hypothetical protein